MISKLRPDQLLFNHLNFSVPVAIHSLSEKAFFKLLLIMEQN